MRVLVQRSLESSVSVDSKVVGKIDKGLVLLVGFTEGDGKEQIEYLAKKEEISFSSFLNIFLKLTFINISIIIARLANSPKFRIPKIPIFGGGFLLWKSVFSRYLHRENAIFVSCVW